MTEWTAWDNSQFRVKFGKISNKRKEGSTKFKKTSVNQL